HAPPPPSPSTLSLHDALPIFPGRRMMNSHLCTVALARQLLPELKSFRLGALAEHFSVPHRSRHRAGDDAHATARVFIRLLEHLQDRKSTRLNSSHLGISYAVF